MVRIRNNTIVPITLQHQMASTKNLYGLISWLSQSIQSKTRARHRKTHPKKDTLAHWLRNRGYKRCASICRRRLEGSKFVSEDPNQTGVWESMAALRQRHKSNWWRGPTKPKFHKSQIFSSLTTQVCIAGMSSQPQSMITSDPMTLYKIWSVSTACPIGDRAWKTVG